MISDTAGVNCVERLLVRELMLKDGKMFRVELAGSSGIRLRREGGCAILSGLYKYRLAAK